MLTNFEAVLHNLKLSKKGRIIINYDLHKTAGEASCVLILRGEISYYDLTNLVLINDSLIAVRKRIAMLIPHVQFFKHLHRLGSNGSGMIFQQENARPRVARIVMDYPELSHIGMLHRLQFRPTCL